MSNSEKLNRKLIDWETVRARVGNPSKATNWRMRKRGDFPEPVRISPGRIGWYEDDIDAWIASRSSIHAA